MTKHLQVFVFATEAAFIHVDLRVIKASLRLLDGARRRRTQRCVLVCAASNQAWRVLAAVTRHLQDLVFAFAATDWSSELVASPRLEADAKSRFVLVSAARNQEWRVLCRIDPVPADVCLCKVRLVEASVRLLHGAMWSRTRGV